MGSKSKPDLSEFIKYAMRSKKAPCKVGLARDQLAGQDLTNLDAAIEDHPRIPNSAVEEFLRVRDLKGVTGSALTSHRKGTCTCDA